VKFYRDMLGLQLKFESPGWSEFVTGQTTLALHPASEKNPAGKVELGFTVTDVEAFYRETSAKGVLFSMAPKKTGFRRGAGAVRRFRRRTLQPGRRGCENLADAICMATGPPFAVKVGQPPNQSHKDS
jgi:hypothetical protein